MGYTHGVYFVAQIGFGIVFILVTAGVAHAICWTPLLKYHLQKKDKNAYARSFRYAKLIVKWLFPYVKKEMKDGQEIIVILTKEVHFIIIAFLAVVVIGIISITFGIFWIVFFIEESIEGPTTCPDGFDCYPIDHLSKTFYMSNVEDCTNHTAEKFACYRFACNIGDAVGNATATLGFSWISATVIIWFFQWTANKLKKNKHISIGYKLCGKLGIMQLVLSLIWIALMIVPFAYWYKNRLITLTCALQIFSFSFLMLIASMVPWYLCFKNIQKDIYSCPCCQVSDTVCNVGGNEIKFLTLKNKVDKNVRNAFCQTLHCITINPPDQNTVTQQVSSVYRVVITEAVKTAIAAAAQSQNQNDTISFKRIVCTTNISSREDSEGQANGEGREDSERREDGEGHEDLCQAIKGFIAHLLQSNISQTLTSELLPPQINQLPPKVTQAIHNAIIEALEIIESDINQAVEDAKQNSAHFDVGKVIDATFELLKQINAVVNGHNEA